MSNKPTVSISVDWHEQLVADHIALYRIMHDIRAKHYQPEGFVLCNECHNPYPCTSIQTIEKWGSNDD